MNLKYFKKLFKTTFKAFYDWFLVVFQLILDWSYYGIVKHLVGLCMDDLVLER